MNAQTLSVNPYGPNNWQLGYTSNTGSSGASVVSTNPAVAASQNPVITASNPWITFVAIIVILCILKWAMEHEKSGMQPAFMGIGMYNFIAVTLMATLGILTEKAIVNKYPIKGVTNLINGI